MSYWTPCKASKKSKRPKVASYKLFKSNLLAHGGLCTATKILNSTRVCWQLNRLWLWMASIPATWTYFLLKRTSRICSTSKARITNTFVSSQESLSTSRGTRMLSEKSTISSLNFTTTICQRTNKRGILYIMFALSIETTKQKTKNYSVRVTNSLTSCFLD